MSEHQISLSEEVYSHLKAVAASQGVSPADWIAHQLPKTSSEETSIVESVSDLIGAIDSQEEPLHSYERTTFGEAVADKLAKQGIYRQ